MMRTQFLDGCESEQEAYELAPWAAEVIAVEGGYMAFESVTDAETWRNQV